MPLLSLAAKLAVLGHVDPQSPHFDSGKRWKPDIDQTTPVYSFAVADCQALVVWLEGSCIRALPVSERLPLQQSNWQPAFKDYLIACGCPLLTSTAYYQAEDIPAYLCWLIGHAIAMLFEDSS
jgi:hypothetical protein